MAESGDTPPKTKVVPMESELAWLGVAGFLVVELLPAGFLALATALAGFFTTAAAGFFCEGLFIGISSKHRNT